VTPAARRAPGLTAAHPAHGALAPPPLDEREALRVAELFRSLADPTRLRILALLAAGETCVHVVCRRLGLGQSAVSHQLRLLRVAHLVRPRLSPEVKLMLKTPLKSKGVSVKVD